MTLFENRIVSADLKHICSTTDWSAFDGKSILITGANGHIATYLTYSFLFAIQAGKLNATVIALSRNGEKLRAVYAPFIGMSYFRGLEADVSEKIDLKERVDYIFHFAGNASPYHISTDPVGILKANIQGTFNVAELAKRNAGCKIIYSSSREVYGKNDSEERLSEKSFGSLDPVLPRSCYPESKRASEAVLAAYGNQYGVGYGIARIAHCYGPGMNLSDDGRVMSDFLDKALGGDDIVIHSDGSMLRAFCYVGDVIRGLLILAAYNGPGRNTFNLSNETEEISILDLARLIAGKVPGIRVEVLKRDIDTGKYCADKRVPLDCSALMELGWSPEIGLKEGIARTFESFIN